MAYQLLGAEGVLGQHQVVGAASGAQRFYAPKTGLARKPHSLIDVDWIGSGFVAVPPDLALYDFTRSGPGAALGAKESWQAAVNAVTGGKR